MSRIPLLNLTQAPASCQPLLDQVQNAFGTLPNMFKAVAHSPAALRSLWSFFGALGTGVIDAPLGEQIAVAVAERNACEYCLAAHTALGRKAGMSAAAMHAAQGGESMDVRTAAALRFSIKLVDQRGQITDADVQLLRDVGFSDEQIVEIVAHVALNVFTNYINVAFQVPLDFPAIKLRQAA